MFGEPVRGGFPDPAIYSLPGVEQLRAYLSGLAPQPPLGHLTGAKLTQVGSGTVSLSMPASPWLMQAESIEVTMLAARGLTSAVRTGVPPATKINLAAASIHHLRRANPESGGVIARGRVLHTGRRVAVAEVLVEDGSGRGVAHGTGSVTTEPMETLPPERPLRPVEEPRYNTPDPYLRPAPEPVPVEMMEQNKVLELLRMVVDEKLTFPIGELLGIRGVYAAEGQLSLALPTSDWLCLEQGQVAAAVLMALASFSLHGATLTVTPKGQHLVPLHQAVQFVGVVRPDGRDVVALGRVADWNGGLAVALTELVDADGKVVARGQQTAIPTPLRVGQSATRWERVLTTVLFTDIAGSTRLAESLGDLRWQDVLHEHHALVRRHLEMFRGREIKTTGDGFLATFDSPARAVQCARALRDALRRLGLNVRIGMHTGECQVSGADLAGIAVHVASRIQSIARPGEILASSTVRDIVAGSGLQFTDRGVHELQGLEGKWHLFATES